jgi:hypothetical protein
MWQMHPWFEQTCPAGHYITAMGISVDGHVTGLSALCDDGTTISPKIYSAAMPNPSIFSADGFSAVNTRRRDSGVCSIQYVFSNGSFTELLGTPAEAAGTTEVKLLCSEDARERLIGFYGRWTFQNNRALIGALGVVCGRQGKPSHGVNNNFQFAASLVHVQHSFHVSVSSFYSTVVRHYMYCWAFVFLVSNVGGLLLDSHAELFGVL